MYLEGKIEIGLITNKDRARAAAILSRGWTSPSIAVDAIYKQISFFDLGRSARVHGTRNFTGEWDPSLLKGHYNIAALS